MKLSGPMAILATLLLVLSALLAALRGDLPAGVHCGCGAEKCQTPCSSCCSPNSCMGMQGFVPDEEVRFGLEDEAPEEPVVRPPR